MKVQIIFTATTVCSRLKSHDNGRMHLIFDENRVTAIFNCNDGYTLKGTRKLSCADEFQNWSSSQPVCVKG